VHAPVAGTGFERDISLRRLEKQEILDVLSINGPTIRGVSNQVTS